MPIYRGPIDVADVTPGCPNSHNVTGRRDVAAGAIPRGRVVVAGGVVIERSNSNGGVKDASGVEPERTRTGRRVEVAGTVGKERSVTGGCVEVAGGVINRHSGWTTVQAFDNSPK